MRFDRAKFFDGFRPWFHQHGGELRDDHVKNLEFLLTKFEASEWFFEDVRRVAYATATMHVETFVPKTGQRYEPVTEVGPRSYFNKYELKFNPRKAKQLGNTQVGDGFLFRGRGYVQITGRDNYIKFGIVDTPDKALDPDFAFHILEQGMRYGLFTRISLNHYINADGCDYENARRVINGTNRAAEIAGYAIDLEQILTDSAADPAVSLTDEGAALPKDASDDTANVPPSVDPPPANPGDVVVEKETNIGFFAGIKLKLASWFATLGGLTGLQGYKEQVDGLGVPGAVIKYVLAVAIAAFILWLIYEGAMHLWRLIAKRMLTTSLVAANATPTNVVTVACPEDLAKYQAAGYTVVTRQ